MIRFSLVIHPSKTTSGRISSNKMSPFVQYIYGVSDVLVVSSADCSSVMVPKVFIYYLTENKDTKRLCCKCGIVFVCNLRITACAFLIMLTNIILVIDLILLLPILSRIVLRHKVNFGTFLLFSTIVIVSGIKVLRNPCKVVGAFRIT